MNQENIMWVHVLSVHKFQKIDYLV